MRSALGKQHTPTPPSKWTLVIFLKGPQHRRCHGTYFSPVVHRLTGKSIFANARLTVGGSSAFAFIALQNSTRDTLGRVGFRQNSPTLSRPCLPISCQPSHESGSAKNTHKRDGSPETQNIISSVTARTRIDNLFDICIPTRVGMSTARACRKILRISMIHPAWILTKNK